MVLASQQQLLPELRQSIRNLHKNGVYRLDRKFAEQEKTIINPVKDIDRMQIQAERIYGSIRDLLDLKQKHANAFEARFARDQSAGTVRQGRTIMVFTIVTVVFLPLSFIATILTINVESYPHNAQGNQEMSLSWASQYIFGIGLAISIPLILAALSLDEISYGYDLVRKWFRGRWRTRSAESDGEAMRKTQIRHVEQTLSRARSMRRSVELSELQWNGRFSGPRHQLSGLTQEAPTKRSWDIERGVRYPR